MLILILSGIYLVENNCGGERGQYVITEAK
jgi:hypothetical protein